MDIHSISEEELEEFKKAFEEYVQANQGTPGWITPIISNNIDEFDLEKEFERLIKESEEECECKCECGKEKHGFANHTSWCPKYE